jgi:hypothetical protein
VLVDEEIAWDTWWREQRTRAIGVELPDVLEPNVALPFPERVPAAGDFWSNGVLGNMPPQQFSNRTPIGVSTVGQPDPRFRPQSVWTGDRMLVWGGSGLVYYAIPNGGLHDPDSDTWQIMTNDGAPERRANHAAVWTGESMIIWGATTPRIHRATTAGSISHPRATPAPLQGVQT